MRLEHLQLSRVRNIDTLDLELGARLNLILGPNGAGKTSVLEAAYLLGHARSFRSAQHAHLIQHGSDRLWVRGRVQRADGRHTELALARTSTGWEGRVDRRSVDSLSEVLREFALVCFEPGSHVLISGPGRERRRFLDWTVFHVEPAYLEAARNYRRTLRQRNAALKRQGGDAELDSWDARLAEAGESLASLRGTHFGGFASELSQVLGAFLPELGEVRVELDRGWPQTVDLVESLARARRRDRQNGHTSCGPHRADWTLTFRQAPLVEHLSRGQEKLCALGCAFAQARLYAQHRGEWPVIALDDLASELDQAHQTLVVDALLAAGAQALITGIDVPSRLRDDEAAQRRFHVEHGRVRSLL